jgi:hypothetical protein
MAKEEAQGRMQAVPRNLWWWKGMLRWAVRLDGGEMLRDLAAGIEAPSEDFVPAPWDAK